MSDFLTDPELWSEELPLAAPYAAAPYDCCEHCRHDINDPPHTELCPEGCNTAMAAAMRYAGQLHMTGLSLVSSLVLAARKYSDAIAGSDPDDSTATCENRED